MNDIEAQSIVASKLQPGETLVWYGAPSPLRAARQYLGMLAFITLWLGFVARTLPAGISSIKAADAYSLNPAVLGPLLFCGFGAGFWLWTAKKIADCWRTGYGLTNRRLIIAVGTGGPVESYSADAFSDMARTGDAQQGSILFAHGQRGRASGYKARPLWDFRSRACRKTDLRDAFAG